MPKTQIIPQTYKTLLTHLQKQLKISQNSFERQLVITYWNIGKGIDVYLKKNPQNYLTALTCKLSKDLNIHQRTLQQCHQLFSVFPSLDFKIPISWSHYRALLSLDSDKKRAYWQKRIVKEDINFKELLGFLKQDKLDSKTPKGKLAKPVRGVLYHYRLMKVSYVDKRKASIVVDCGFENRIVPPKHDGLLENKRIIVSFKENDYYRIKYTKDVLKDNLYTFKAHVERVVDGDTLVCNVDCGFGIWSRQKLRLKGIDAPEMDTVMGVKAKSFVEDVLRNCVFIIVKTSKSDKYDRYLADIFFKEGESDAGAVAKDGEYLNQLLMDKGLAEIYR
ncbi:MAG: thermonuclease family protein [Candidatus Omnitrophica bacterium]|nr:thermonuclease family protein [Candidatus Omnitrophota bacterium]